MREEPGCPGLAVSAVWTTSDMQQGDERARAVQRHPSRPQRPSWFARAANSRIRFAGSPPLAARSRSLELLVEGDEGVRKELGHEAYGVLRSDPRAAPMVFEETAYRVPVCVSPSPEMVSTAVGRVVVLDVCRKWSILHLRWPMTEYSPREGPHSRPKESQMQYKRSLCFREKNPAR